MASKRTFATNRRYMSHAMPPRGPHTYRRLMGYQGYATFEAYAADHCLPGVSFWGWESRCSRRRAARGWILGCLILLALLGLQGALRTLHQVPLGTADVDEEAWQAGMADVHENYAWATSQKLTSALPNATDLELAIVAKVWRQSCGRQVAPEIWQELPPSIQALYDTLRKSPVRPAAPKVGLGAAALAALRAVLVLARAAVSATHGCAHVILLLIAFGLWPIPPRAVRGWGRALWH